MTAQEKDIPYIKMPSGAGHDAMHMADIAQAGMIFIPSINGISHNIAEKLKDGRYCPRNRIITSCNY